MNGALQFFRSGWQLVLLAMLCPSLHGEAIATLNEASGAILVQVQDLRPDVSYHVGFWELGADKPTAILTVPPIGRKSFTSLRWETPAEGIYQARLQRDADWIPVPAPSPITLPELGFTLITGAMDHHTGKIRFQLPSAGLFRVTAMTESAMHVAHLRGWHLGGAGRQYVVDWDFWNDQKTQSHRKTPGLVATMDFIPLPAGYIVAGFPAYERYRSSGLNRNVIIPEAKMDVHISFPESSKRSSRSDGSKALPVVHAGEPVRVELTANTLHALKDRRYEVIYFLNGEFIHEEAKGVSPTIYRMPSIPRLKGDVFLTVNIRDFFGNVGAVTTQFHYKSNASASP
jgi:hypothetical protein